MIAEEQMKRPRVSIWLLLVPVAVFLVSLGTTEALMRHPWSHSGYGAQHEAGNPMGKAVVSDRSRPAAQDGGGLLARTCSLLRAGDRPGLLVMLTAAAEKNPKGFLGMLRDLPYLPDFPDLEELVATAGSQLSWSDPESIPLLEGIGPAEWRDDAWIGFVEEQAGKVDDEALLQVIHRARTHDKSRLFRVLCEEAAKTRPEEFFRALKKVGRGENVATQGEDRSGPYRIFYTELTRENPELAQEMLKR